MANALPQNQQKLQDEIHVLYENDTSTPAVDSPPWKLRQTLINRMIGDWGDTEDVQWRELFQHYVGTQAVTLNNQDYTISADDIRKPGSFVRFKNANGELTFVDVVDPNDMTKFRENARVVYFTGDPGNGYTMHLGWNPQANDQILGCTFAFDYYSTPVLLQGVGDVPQMSDTGYITYGVAATLHLLDGSSDQYTVFSSKSQAAMDNMKVRNIELAWNSDNRLDDVDQIRHNAVLGY